MSCSNCDYAMQRISETERVFWCPRCGTIKLVPTGAHTKIHIPTLVERCKKLEANQALPEPRKVLHYERKKIAEIAIAWIKQQGGKLDDATNIVTALDATGFLRMPPCPSMPEKGEMRLPIQ